MCYIIKADDLLSYLLKENKKLSFLSYKDLYEIRNEFYKIHPEIILDISGPAINRALIFYPYIFKETKTGIQKKVGGTRFLNSMNSTIPDDIKKTLSQITSSHLDRK